MRPYRNETERTEITAWLASAPLAELSRKCTLNYGFMCRLKNHLDEIDNVSETMRGRIQQALAGWKREEWHKKHGTAVPQVEEKVVEKVVPAEDILRDLILAELKGADRKELALIYARIVEAKK